MGKRCGSSDVQYVKIHNMVAVLTSAADLGSITPTVREDRKRVASIAVKRQEICSQKCTFRLSLWRCERFPQSCFSFMSPKTSVFCFLSTPIILGSPRSLNIVCNVCIISCNFLVDRGMWVVCFSCETVGVWQTREDKDTDWQVMEDVCMAPDRDTGRGILYLLFVWVRVEGVNRSKAAITQGRGF